MKERERKRERRKESIGPVVSNMSADGPQPCGSKLTQFSLRDVQ